MKRLKSTPLLLSLLVAFFVTAVISVFCLMTYFQINDRLKKIALSESEQFLAQSVETISTSFHNTWGVFANSETSNSFANILSDSAETQTLMYGALLSLSAELSRSFYLDDYIQDVGLFISNGNTDYWCTTKIISHDFRNDYESGLYSFDDMSYDSFRNMILNSTDNRVVRKDFHIGQVTSKYSNSYSYRMIYLIYPVMQNQHSMQAFAVMQINLDRIEESLTAFQYSGSYFSLYANNVPVYTTNQNVYFSGTEQKLYLEDGSETYYVQNFISELGLACYLSLDSDKIYQGITPFSSLLLLLFSLLIITVLTLVLFFFRYWLIPVTRIADSIPNSESTKNAISKINQHLIKLSDQIKITQYKLLKYEKNSILKDIYLGKTTADQDELALSVLDPLFENNYRCICIGSLIEEPHQPLNADYIIGQIEDSSITAGAFAVFDDILTCLIVQTDQYLYASSNEFFTHMNDLLAAINSDSGCQYTIGISDIYNGIVSIPSAYHEARKNWQSALLWQIDAVVFSTSLSQCTNSYSVNYAILETLYQSIITNNPENALNIFDQLVTANFSNSKSERQRALYCQQFTSDILGVLVRISTEYDIHAIIESYMSDSVQLSLNKRIALLRNVIIECCEFIPIHDYDKDLSNAIIEYCRNHYNDYQLSLSLLEDQFHLSKSSISKYFKANTGYNFSSYIEKLRIQQAEKLILENKLSVREIAEKIGYQNITTFYNAFRKVKKCTPTQWRQQMMR